MTGSGRVFQSLRQESGNTLGTPVDSGLSFRAGTNNRVNSAPLCIEACDPGITGTYSGEGAAFCMKYETGKYSATSALVRTACDLDKVAQVPGSAECPMSSKWLDEMPKWLERLDLRMPTTRSHLPRCSSASVCLFCMPPRACPSSPALTAARRGKNRPHQRQRVLGCRP